MLLAWGAKFEKKTKKNMANETKFISFNASLFSVCRVSCAAMYGLMYVCFTSAWIGIPLTAHGFTPGHMAFLPHAIILPSQFVIH